LVIVRTKEEFVKNIDYSKKIIIYGAGWAGRTVCKFLENYEIQVKAFAVTTPKVWQKQDEIPVLGLDDILSCNNPKDLFFLLAVTRTHRNIMESVLERQGIRTYIEFADVLFYDIAWENRVYIAKEFSISREKRNGQMTIGYLMPGYYDTDYAEKRLIIGKIEESSYLALPKETEKLISASLEYEKRPEEYHQMIEACYSPEWYEPKVDLIHTFNSVCNTDKPWCASFETVLPRMICVTQQEKEYYQRLIECMKKPNCKALYALCRNAYEIQRNMLKETLDSPTDLELLMSKTKVLHPPQEVLITEEAFERKHRTEKIHFIFVGGAFFIKGGREMIETLSEFEGKYNFDLTLISSLLYDDYFTKTSYEEMLRCRKMIQECKWIDYYDSLPNEEVLEKCREETVGLFPSVADTYGYALLEMQAAGCPVVTTNVRAFPETNNEHCGWICYLPVDRFGFCVEDDANKWSEILKCELRRCFQEIFEHPEEIREKGRNAIKRIREMHDPYAYQVELRKNLER